MTKLVALAFALMTSTAFASSTADLTTQMQNILGDWRLPGQAVLRIEQQSDQSVKLYWCDESTYFNSSNKQCTYSFIKIYQYRSDLDAFYAPPARAIVPSRSRSRSNRRINSNAKATLTNLEIALQRARSKKRLNFKTSFSCLT